MKICHRSARRRDKCNDHKVARAPRADEIDAALGSNKARRGRYRQYSTEDRWDASAAKCHAVFGSLYSVHDQMNVLPHAGEEARSADTHDADSTDHTCYVGMA